jgi:hypothetical protein
MYCTSIYCFVVKTNVSLHCVTKVKLFSQYEYGYHE